MPPLPPYLKKNGRLKHHIKFLPFSGSAHHIPVHSSLIPAHLSIFRYHSSAFCFISVSFHLIPAYFSAFHSIPVFNITPSHSASLRCHSGSFRYIISGTVLVHSVSFRCHSTSIVLVFRFILFHSIPVFSNAPYAGKNIVVFFFVFLRKYLNC